MKLYYCIEHEVNIEFYIVDTGYGVMELINESDIELAPSLEYLIQLWNKYDIDVTVVRVL